MTLGVPYLAVGGNAAAGPASTAFTVTHSTATSDCIAAWVTVNTGTITSVSDSQGNVYKPQQLAANGSLHGQWWVADNAKALTAGGGTPDTITVTPSTASASRTISAIGCSGVAAGASPDYRSANNTSGSSAAPSVTSGALVWKDELSLAGLVNGNTGGPVTWTGTFAGATVADTQHNGTTQYGSAAALVTHLSPWPQTATVTGAGTLTSTTWAMAVLTLRAQTAIVGASIGSPGSFFPGTPSMAQAIASFDGWVGRKMASQAVRAYYLPGTWPAQLSNTWQGWIAAGMKIVINFKPGGNTHAQTSAEAANMAAAIKMWQNAGANFDVTIWHEPNQAGVFTPSQYAAYVAYYAPTVRGTSPEAVAAGIAPSSLGYIPILGTGGSATAYAMYPGDQYVDWIMPDFYGSAYHSGVRLNVAQSGDAHSLLFRATNHSPAPVPIGMGEWNAGAGTQITLAEWNAYVAHLIAVFSAAQRCDMIFWMGNSSGCQDQIINNTDFKIPGPGPNACPIPNFSNRAGNGLQTFYDAVQPGTGAGSPSITTTSPLPAGTTGTPYSVALTASGGTPPYTWSVTTGQLPAGLTLAANGTITGTPSAAGTSSIGFTVTDNAALTGTATLSLTIAGAQLAVPAQSPPPATQGVPYAFQLGATGGTPPDTWALLSGALPAGLALSSGGLISGTPTGTGTSSFTPQVTDHLGTTASRALSITVTAPVYRIITAALPGAVLGQSYSGEVDTAGGTAPDTAWSVISGQLPPGLVLAALPVATDFHLTDEAGNQITDEASSPITDESGP